MFPQARRDGLTVCEMPDETLVYDRQRHQAHCLNRTAALIWRQCDGRTSVARIAEVLQRAVQSPMGQGVIQLALNQLERAHLLQPSEEPPPWRRAYSRREVVGKLGIAALLAPAVLSITAPKASAQTSPGRTTAGTTAGTTTAGTTTTGTTTAGTTTAGTTTGGTTAGTTAGTTTGGTTAGTTVGGTTAGTTVGGTTAGTTTVGTTAGGTTAGSTTAGTTAGTTGTVQ